MRGGNASLDEHLHADVMRFLAIIAFCLIAIFALVRNTEAPEPQPEPPASVAAAEPIVPLAAETPISAPAAGRVEPLLAPPSPADPPPKASQPPQSGPASERPPSADAARPAPRPSEPAPLALKFTSDAAFLRLLSSGRARLYAGAADGWMTLHQGTQWQSVSAPPSYHELLLATLPRIVIAGFPGNPARVQWGVTLPASTERAIARLAARHESGRLLIDRDANVRFSP